MKIEDLRKMIESWLNDLSKNHGSEKRKKSENTIKLYTRTLNKFVEYLESEKIEEIDNDTLDSYKEAMKDEKKRNEANPKPGRKQLKSFSTINTRLIILNKFFKDFGYPEFTTELINDETGTTNDEILTEKEYRRILEWADKMGKEKIKLILETLVGTGIRISELEFLRVEDLKRRVFVVNNKGKVRNAFIPKQLAKKLKAYCEKNNITEGIIFHGRDKSKMLDQSVIRKEFKAIAGKARGIKKDKCHPHALRHLFAKRYSNMPGANPFILPALLGHSTKTQVTTFGSVTPIYTKPSKKELLKVVDELEAYYTDKKKQLKKRVSKKKAA